MCNHCLQRVRRQYPEYDAACDAYVYENQNHLRWAVAPWSDADPSAHREYDTSGRKVTFCQCGRENGRAADDDYSYSELKERLRCVIDRLTEAGLDMDESVMYEFVEGAKCKRQIGGKDTQILRRATKLGLKHA
ncbi:hypothetical protein [Haladaptatus salinisoli]|uniref:hypothetical protein n=1 Tax=Haladaptatus salinisoli TaxID=2884876 RepID=UPI001D0B57F3|nr:hypothetical protein [Haladaptatus salinisoli]